MRSIKPLPLLLAALVLVAQGQAKTWKDIQYPALPAFTIPKPEVYTLKNGMRVFLMEDHELPLIQVQARIRTGSWYEPAEKAGLASLMGGVQRSGGTTTLPADRMDELLALRAASVETGVGDDSGFASMDCLKQDFDEVFKIFADVLRNPAFPEDRIQVDKGQLTTGIARRNDDPGSVAGREFTALVYGKDSPLAREPEYATVAAITRQDLVDFHARFYHPNNVYLGVVGDFSSPDMKKKIEAVLGVWPRGPETKPIVPPFREPKPGVYFVEKGDVNQSNIRMGYLGMKISDPDYFATQVMNEVLGGGFASRLFSNVRSKKGLAYGVFGGVGAGFEVPGVFQVGMGTKSETTVAGIDALREEVEGLEKTPPTEAEIKRAKDSILNSFIFNYDSREEVLGQQMVYAYHGLPANFLETYRANVEKVGPADVKRVIERFIHPEKMTVLVVGKAADFDKPLASLGAVTPVDITIPPPPDTTPKVERTAGAAAAGKEVLARLVKTVGGSDPQAVTAMRSVQNVALSAGGMAITVKQTEVKAFPDRMRQTMQTPMGEQTLVLAGDAGAALTPAGTQPLPAEKVAEAKKEAFHDLSFLARVAGEVDAVAAGSETVEGTACDVVAVTYQGSESRLCVAQDGKALKQSFTGENPMSGAPGRIEVTYADWREVSGRQLPFKQTITIDGQPLATVTVETIEVNPTLDPALFEVPKS
ncbi:MAG TPA: pitrilysin family protein [Candidatus Polarisedimenticolaceae bacterium]|nr:pitrilysin family protein [Candidatus Polarisedimenticolaceae bacterium]